MSKALYTRHRLLALLLSQWGTQQERITPKLQLRLQRLWRVLPDDCTLEELKDYLCPVFATNARQQEVFIEIFDRLLFTTDLLEPAAGGEEQDMSMEAQTPAAPNIPEPQKTPQPGQYHPVASGMSAIRDRRPYVIELDNLDKYNQPPLIWNIVPDTAGPTEIDLGEGFGQTLLRLRRREMTGHALLDLPETVAATIQQAGLPAFRFRYRSRPPEYLLLVERYSQHDHRSGLFDFFFRSLRANAVFVERFFYGGDLRICRNERFPAGLSPIELRNRYPNARLLVLGTGYKLISGRTGELADWTAPLYGWPVRVLLTPTPQPQWGRREQMLAKLFTLLPASVQSLQYVAENPDSTAVQYEALPDYIRRIAEVQPIEIGDEPLILALRRHFDKAMICWIAACAIYPALHYALTLRIGRLLSGLFEQDLVTADKLLSLSRLPWFVEGRIPKQHRDELLGYLSHRHPKEHTAVLHDLSDMLKDERNVPPPESAAWLDYQVQLAFIRLETHAVPDAHDLNLLRSVVKRLDRPEQLGDVLAPRRWEEVLGRLEDFEPDIKELTLRLLVQLLCPPNEKSILPKEGFDNQRSWVRNFLFQKDKASLLVLDIAEDEEIKYRTLKIKVDYIFTNDDSINEQEILSGLVARYAHLLNRFAIRKHQEGTTKEEMALEFIEFSEKISENLLSKAYVYFGLLKQFTKHNNEPTSQTMNKNVQILSVINDLLNSLYGIYRDLDYDIKNTTVNYIFKFRLIRNETEAITPTQISFITQSRKK